MQTLKEAVDDFLAQKRIAVVGVSRDPRQAANFVFRKLRGAGHDVFAVNRAARSVEGGACYPDLKSIEGGVAAVVVMTPPGAAAEVVRECAALGIRRVWLHRSFGQGSASDEAVAVAQAANLTLIPAGCPAMFCEPVDVGHRCFRWFMKISGKLPATIGDGQNVKAE